MSKSHRWTIDPLCSSTAVTMCDLSSAARLCPTCPSCADGCFVCDEDAKCTEALEGYYLNNSAPTLCVEATACGRGTVAIPAAEMCPHSNNMTALPHNRCKPCANAAATGGDAGCDRGCVAGCIACNGTSNCTRAAAGHFIDASGVPAPCANVTNCADKFQSMTATEMCPHGNNLTAHPTPAAGCKRCANSNSTGGGCTPCRDGCAVCQEDYGRM